MNTEIISGLKIGDTIRAMYITIEGMNSAGISTMSEQFDINQIRDGNMRNMNSQFGGG